MTAATKPTADVPLSVAMVAQNLLVMFEMLKEVFCCGRSSSFYPHIKVLACEDDFQATARRLFDFDFSKVN